MNTEKSFDPYVVLGVTRTASIDEIELAYRRAASKAHPDRAGGSTEAMTDVNMAWKILSDAEMRAKFDADESLKVDPIDVRARTFMIPMVMQIIRSLPPEHDMLFALRGAIQNQLEGMKAARAKTTSDLDGLRERIKRLKGPPDNFIENILLLEIKKGEETLPRFDADEEIFLKALEMLKDYKYGIDQLINPHWQVSAHTGGLGLW